MAKTIEKVGANEGITYKEALIQVKKGINNVNTIVDPSQTEQNTMHQEVHGIETQTMPLRKERNNNIERKENPSENAIKKKVTEIGTQTENMKENLDKEGK